MSQKVVAATVNEFGNASIDVIADILSKKNSWGKNEAINELRTGLLNLKFEFLAKQVESNNETS